MSTVNRKKIVQRIIAGVLLVCVISAGLFFTTKKTEAGWYDDNWAYRKAINITGHTAAENNVFLNLTGGSALDSQGASKTNCGDIRFTDANGKVLPYFIVSGCKTASTVIHVFFETFPAGAQTIYYYYGNPSARDGFSLTDFSTAATGVTFGSYGSQEVGPGPVAYWKFDEGYGTVPKSNTQTGPSMTINSDPYIPWQSEELCVSGKCLFFDAYGTLTANATIGDVKTVQFWVKPKTNAGTLFDVDGTGTLAYIVATNGVITAPGFTSPSFYINGVYTTSPTLVANIWQHITVTSNTGVTMSAVSMGEPSGAGTFSGFIDEVKLYRTVRTASEIKSDAQRWAGAEGSSAIVSSGQNANTTTPLSTGLVGYWKMDETSWTNDCSTATVMDASGNGTHGLSCPASTGPTGGTSGKYGNGALYDYVDNYISINNSTVYAPMNAPFSASAWVYLNSFSDQYPTILRLRSDDIQPWFIIFSNQTNYLGVSIGNQANFAGIKTDIPSSSLTGAWRHVVATYNGKGSNNINNFKIYLDGVLLTNSASGAYASHSQATSIGYNSSGNRWNGYIDEVRVYNRELNYNDARSLYYWSPGPVGYWKMDEGVGQIAQDSSGNNNTGTLTNSPTWASGKYGSGVQFANGTTNKHISVPPASSLNNLTQLTYATWVKFTTNVDDVGLFGKSGNVQLYINEQATGQFRPKFAVTFSGDDLDIVLTDISNLSAGLWYHLAVTWDGGTSVNSARIYINGVEQTKHANSLPATGTKTDDSGNTFYIGNRASLVYQVNGAMDEAKVYNYVRSPSQVIEDMNAGHPAPGSPVGSPLLHLSFEEGYGDTAYDSSAQLNHGNMSGSTTCPSASICPTWSNEGKFGKAMYFGALQTADGDSHIRLTNDKYDTLTEGALSFWFKSDGVGTDNDIFGAAEDDNGTGSDFVGVLFNAQDSMLNLGISNNGSLALNVVTQAIPNTTAWHHAVVNMSSSGHEIFVDGKKQTLTYLSGNSSTALWFDDIAENTTAYTVGCSDFDGSDTNDCNGNGFFAGTIDEFKLFTQPLTQEQINIEFNGGVSQSMGAASTTSDGVTSSNSSSREYCIPGDNSTCNAPILHFKMDEGVGATVNDTSSNNLTGSLLDFPAQSQPWVQGKKGKGIQFGQSDPYINFYSSTLNSLFSGSEGTAMIWLKARDSAVWTDNISTVLFKFGPDTSNTVQIQKNSTNELAFTYAAGGTTEASYHFITPTGWTHMAITWSKSNERVRYYLNGVLTETDTALGVWSGSLASNRTIIGNNYNGTSAWNGSLDDFILYNYERTSSQIAWDYNKGAPYQWYKFNECQGTTIYDSAQTSDGKSTGRVGTLTIGGTGTYTSAGSCTSGSGSDLWYGGRVGKFGSGLALDGTNDYASIPSPSLPTGEFTYTAWIYLDSLNNERTVVMTSDGSGANEILLSVVSDQDGTNPSKVRFTADGLSRYSVNPLETGKWYHLAYTRSATHRTLYINGVYDSDTTSGMNALNFSTCQLFIGVDSDTSGCATDLNEYFDGIIDDVRVYSYALNPIQIRTVMNEGSAVRFGP